MPRARNIKPGFFENEHLGEQHSDVRILFASLWTLADRDGIVECRIPRIRTYAFRYRNDVTDEMINNYLTVLSRLDSGKMLSRVKYQDVEYLVIKNFVTHASPHHTEKKGGYPTLEQLNSAELLGNENSNGVITVRPPCNLRSNSPESLILNTDLLNTEVSRAEENSAPARPVILKLNPKELEDDWLSKPLPPDNVIEMWNEVVVGIENKKNHVHLTDDRRKKIHSRARDALPNGQTWLDYFQSIVGDKFCMGEKGWRATIDWALKPTSVVKMREGGYDAQKIYK